MQSGEQLAQFRIIQKLGEGGMGEVYLAEDTKLNRQVAIKTLRDDYFDDQDRRERFEREAKTAAQIQHANVMAIFDIGAVKSGDSARETHFIVMEYIRGKSLENYLATHAGDTGKLLRIAEKIASGIAAAHKLNIVHRDIKAENIIVGDDDEPKILDFGLARPITPLQTPQQAVSGETVKANLTKVGTVIGTVAYMSPEQARGETVDARSDVFSFGVLLYRMFTGQMPFVGQSQVSVLAKILETKQTSPREVKADLDPEIERIVEKCLQKDANDRYQDTRDLVIDLRNLRRQYDSGISNTISGIRDKQHFDREVKKEVVKSRRKRLAIVFPIIAIIMAIILFMKTEIKIEADSSTAQAGQAGLAILTFENKTGDPQLDWLKTGLPEILMTDLAQSQALNIISQRQLLEAIGTDKDIESISLEEQIKAARKLGATNIMSGTIYKLGDKFRIDARLEEAKSGRLLMGEKVTGSDAFAVVDSLTTRIAKSLDMEEMMGTDRNVAQLTTNNPEAYRYFHAGLQGLSAEIWEDAIKNFEKAIAVDSTFALAYMRLGMTYVFQGRMPESTPFFAKAAKYKENMPVRDQRLLEVYTDLWIRRQFDDAYIKLESIVQDYPDDLESKAIYGVLLYEISRDTTKAMQHLNDVLKADPKYQLALGFKVNIFNGMKQYDSALTYLNLIRKYHPESPTSYRGLANLYTRMGKIDEATKAFEDYLGRFPGNADALTSLVSISIRRRDFAKAEYYNEQYAKEFSSDPYEMTDYYGVKANLANWKGQFRTALGYRKKAVEESMKTNDSAIIYQSFTTVANHYENFGFTDSAFQYLQDKYGYTPPMGRVNHTLLLVALKPSKADSLRPFMQKDLADFRSRLPSQLQRLGDLVDDLFEAQASADTARLIEIFEELNKTGSAGTDGDRTIAELAAFSGRYQKAYDYLVKYRNDAGSMTSGLYYPFTLYLFGMANEGLGKTQEAVKLYTEALSYWSNPEIEIPAIKDMKARMARLKS